MKKRLFIINSLFLLSFLFFLSNASAQTNLPELRASQLASVTQNVGFAKIIVNYSRPGVKGREIWGKLVPFGTAPAEIPYGSGEPMPWRAGADENTTISLTHPAKVNGQFLPAGTYGLFMMPDKEEWTIILSKEAKAWGSYFYKQADDALRFKVKPVQAQFQEWLVYGFENLSSGGCEVFLQWEKVKVPFKIEFDANKVTLDYYKDLLKGEAGFYPQGWASAAEYCLDNNYNLAEGLEFINKSMQIGGNGFNNKVVKGRLLIATGKGDEGNKLIEASLETATETELNAYGRQLLNSNKKEEAVKVFTLSINKNPQSWIGYFYLGRAFKAKGDIVNAKVNFKKALDLAPEAQKGNIERYLKE